MKLTVLRITVLENLKAAALAPLLYNIIFCPVHPPPTGKAIASYLKYSRDLNSGNYLCPLFTWYSEDLNSQHLNSGNI